MSVDRVRRERACQQVSLRTVWTWILTLALIAFAAAFYVTVLLPDRARVDLPARLPPLTPLAAFTRTDTAAVRCADAPRFLFVREYFQSPSRSAEIQRALTETIELNVCSRFAVVVSDPDYVRDLGRIHAALDVDLTVYWSAGDVTYDHLLRAITLTDPGAVFVLSTADVRIPALAPLVPICAGFFAPATNETHQLFTISRRDSDKTSCAQYRDWSSWDVFIGNASLIDDYVLDNTKFSPSFWGVENVLVYLLLRGRTRPYNLCPHVDVVHYHAERDDKSMKRIRISHPRNAAVGQREDLGRVCDMDALRREYPGFHG